MGVLRCDRNGCENVMCRYHSQKHGYLCAECYDEAMNSNFRDIGEFMKSEKFMPHNRDFINWTARLESEFCDYYQDDDI